MFVVAGQLRAAKGYVENENDFQCPLKWQPYDKYFIKLTSVLKKMIIR